MKQIFQEAIEKKRKVKIKVYNKKEKTIKEGTCIPFDFFYSKEGSQNEKVFHFYNIDNPDWENHFTIKPKELIYIEMTDESFDPLHQ